MGSKIHEIFKQLAKKTLGVSARQDTLRHLQRELDCYAKNSSGAGRGLISETALVQQLIDLCFNEVDDNKLRQSRAEDKGRKCELRSDTFECVYPFLLKIATEGHLTEEHPYVITWFLRISDDDFFSALEQRSLECVERSLASCAIFYMDEELLLKLWRALWHRFNRAKNGAANPMLDSVLGCLFAIIDVSKRTVLARDPLSFVNTIFKYLDLPVDPTGSIWLRNQVYFWSKLFAIIRLLMRDWAFHFRDLFLLKLELAMEQAASRISFDKTANIAPAWSKVDGSSCVQVQLALACEEYLCLVSPFAALPSSNASKVASTFAAHVAKIYSKKCVSLSGVDPPPFTPHNSRLLARALTVDLLVNDSLPATSSLPVNTPPASRKRKRNHSALLKRMCGLSWSGIMDDMCSYHMEEPPSTFVNFVLVTLTQVFIDYGAALGEWKEMLIESIIQSSASVNKEEYLCSLAKLFTAVLECRDEKATEQDGGQLAQEMWDRAITWTHSRQAFAATVRLLTTCDTTLLSVSPSSRCPSSSGVRVCRLLDVARISTPDNPSLIHLIHHIVTSHHFNERTPFLVYEKIFQTDEWMFRKQLVHWLLSELGVVEVGDVIVSLCHLFPSTSTPHKRRRNMMAHSESRIFALTRTWSEDEEEEEKEEVCELDAPVPTLIRDVVQLALKLVDEKLDDVKSLTGCQLVAYYRMTGRLRKMVERVKEKEWRETKRCIHDTFGRVRVVVASRVESMSVKEVIAMVECGVDDLVGERALLTSHSRALLPHILTHHPHLVTPHHALSLLEEVRDALPSSLPAHPFFYRNFRTFVMQLVDGMTLAADLFEMFNFSYLMTLSDGVVMLEKLRDSLSSSVDHAVCHSSLLSYASILAHIASHRRVRDATETSSFDLREELRWTMEKVVAYAEGEKLLALVALFKAQLSPLEWEHHLDVVMAIVDQSHVLELCDVYVEEMHEYLEEVSVSRDFSHDKNSVWSDRHKRLSSMSRALRHGAEVEEAKEGEEDVQVMEVILRMAMKDEAEMVKAWENVEGTVHRIRNLAYYVNRCIELGMEHRAMTVLVKLSAVEGKGGRKDNNFFLFAEHLAVKTIQSAVRGRCKWEMNEMSRMWSSFSDNSTVRVSPCSFQVKEALEGAGVEMSDGRMEKAKATILQEALNVLCVCDVLWEKVLEKWPALRMKLVTRGAVVECYRMMHESGWIAPASKALIPLLGPLSSLTRRDFSLQAFFEYISTHIYIGIFHNTNDVNADEWHIHLLLECLICDPTEEIDRVIQKGQKLKEEDLAFSCGAVTDCARFIFTTHKNHMWTAFLHSVSSVLPLLGLSAVHVLPYLLHMCGTAGEGAAYLLSFLFYDVSSCDVEDVGLLLAESFTVIGLSTMSRLVREVQSEQEKTYMDSALLNLSRCAEKTGVGELSRIAAHLCTEHRVARGGWLFTSSLCLPSSLHTIVCQDVIVRGDRSAPCGLSPAMLADSQIRQLMAENTHSWMLCESKKGKAALDESENMEYLLRFTRWDDFPKKSEEMEDAMAKGFVVLERDELAAKEWFSRMSAWLLKEVNGKNRSVSNESMRAALRWARPLSLLLEKKGEEMVRVVEGEEPFYFHSTLISTSHALATWKRHHRNETATPQMCVDVHEKVKGAVHFLSANDALRPALRLVHAWREWCSDEKTSVHVAIEEARLRCRMGEELYAAHIVREMKEKNEMKTELFVQCALAEGDILLESTKNRDRSITIVREVADEVEECVWEANAPLAYNTYSRLFLWSSKQLEELETKIGSTAFTMKREAVADWKRLLHETKTNEDCTSEDRRASAKLERELQCEIDDINRARNELFTGARRCIAYGLKALEFASFEEKEGLDLLFPLLHIILTYGQVTKAYNTQLQDHVERVDLAHWVAAVPHLLGYAIQAPHSFIALSYVLVPLVISFPYHTLPRLLFYEADEDGGRDLVEKVLNAVHLRESSMADIVNSMRTVQTTFRELTVGDLNTFAARAPGGDRNALVLRPSCVLLKRQAALSEVPLPTLHIHEKRDTNTVERIVRVSEKAERADGLSAPLIIHVTTDHGKTHSIICKKEDVRQDAMVEQLFRVVNDILLTKQRKEHQPLRAYTVVPLGSDAGLIEFCGGTVSLKQILCGVDRQSGLHKEVHPEDWTAMQCARHLGENSDKLEAFKEICEHFRPVFRVYFYKRYKTVREWSLKLDAYRKSLAQWSMVCFVVGLGDRHASNILFEPHSATFVHIDLGMILEYSTRNLPVPERVPFRLTRDLVDPLLADHLFGKLRELAVQTIEPLREKKNVILGVASVILRERMSNFRDLPSVETGELSHVSLAAINRLRDKLTGTDATATPHTCNEQVIRLMEQATNEKNLSSIFQGWMPFM